MRNPAPRIVAILSGGKGRRLGGVDKGTVKLGDRPLVDHVFRRVSPQADLIVFAGEHNYGLDCYSYPDIPGGPSGPAAGLFAICVNLLKYAPNITGFYTVPIDAPFLPMNLVKRLSERDASAIAATQSGLHPTFAYWETASLMPALENTVAPSLKEIAFKAGAYHVFFEDKYSFTNINSQADLGEAHRISRTNSCQSHAGEKTRCGPALSFRAFHLPKEDSTVLEIDRQLDTVCPRTVR